jgi:hypothetical protein
LPAAAFVFSEPKVNQMASLHYEPKDPSAVEAWQVYTRVDQARLSTFSASAGSLLEKLPFSSFKRPMIPQLLGCPLSSAAARSARRGECFD